MINSVGLQYAKALFDLATINKSANDYYQALLVLNDAILKEESVLQIFMHPAINKEEKKNILKNTLSHLVDEELLNFLFVLIDNNRFLDLPLVIEAYKQLLDEYENKLEVKVYSRYSLTENEIISLKEKLEKHYNKNIIITKYIDESLIGGIRIITDKEVLDASILSSLDELKNNLKKGW